LTTQQTLLLGAVAGSTIFLGLPLGRLKTRNPALQVGLTALAAGVLLFLLIEVTTHAFAPVEEASEEHDWGELLGFGLLFAGGVAAGLMSLVYYDRWMLKQRGRALLGPGAAATAEFTTSWIGRLSAGQWLGLLIATGIGVHNFAEGLAIGQEAANDELKLALALVIGFGLHNATEGFGIVAPLSGSEARPTWKFLALLGLIGGGPTFIGTLLGQTWVNETVSVAFLALAAGSILYVVIQLMNVNQKLGYKTLVAWMLLAGLFLGFATDFIIEAAGV